MRSGAAVRGLEDRGQIHAVAQAPFRVSGDRDGEPVSPDLGKLNAHLQQAEGWRDHVYMDTTGNLTIGFGFNLCQLVLPTGVDFHDVRIIPVTALPRPIGEVWLTHLELQVIADLTFALPWVKSLNEVRQGVLAELAYNLGVPGLLRAPIFLGQVQRGEYAQAAENLRGWLWAKQVGPDRSGRLIGMMRSGQDREP